MKNEKIYVSNYSARVEEDDYKKGRNGIVVSKWGNYEIPVRGGFDSVADALQSVCANNFINWKKDDWQINDMENGRFDGCFTVNSSYFEANEKQIDEWKRGMRKLYALDISVELEYRSARQFDRDECVI